MYHKTKILFAAAALCLIAACSPDMWGYYFDYKCREAYFGNATINYTSEWFKPQILKEIEERTDITASKIFQALPLDVYDHEDLKQRLKSLYGYDDIIDECFSQIISQ